MMLQEASEIEKEPFEVLSNDLLSHDLTSQYHRRSEA